MKSPIFNIPECCHPLLLVNPRAIYLNDNGGTSHGFEFPTKAVAYSKKKLLKMAYHFLDGTDDYNRLSQFYITRDGLEFEYLFNVVKCGKCDVCTYNKQIDLVNRSAFEDQLYDSPAFFFTLTYRTADLPPAGNLCYKDVQDFFKRLRRRWDRKGIKHDIRYLVAGEYGTNYHRPHYHVILWNNPYKASELKPSLFDALKDDIFNAWSHADPQAFDFGQVSGGASRYVTKYVGKQFIPKGKWIKPFIHMSCKNGGIGRPFISPKKDYYQSNPSKSEFEYIDVDGKFQHIHFGSYLKSIVHPSPSRMVPSAVRNLYNELCDHLQDYIDWFPQLYDYCYRIAEDARPYKSVVINPLVRHDPRTNEYNRRSPCARSFRLWVISKEFPTVLQLADDLASVPDDLPDDHLQKYYDFINRQVPKIDNRYNLAGKLLKIHEKRAASLSKTKL